MDLTGPGLFGIQSIDYTALLPTLLVAAGALAVLVADLFLSEDHKPRLAWATIGVLAAALIAEAGLWSSNTVVPRNTFCMPNGAPGGGACSYSVDNFTLTLQTLVLAATVLVVLMAPRRFKVPSGEYHFLLLCSLTGAMVLVAARDFITITIALETLSLPAFALVGFGRRAGGEAALKFFLMSIASTAVMLFGISLIYGVTNTVFFEWTNASLARIQAQGGPQAAVAATGMVLTLVGFAFKISAVPFHFWTPEVYAGAPIPVAAYLSVVSKAAGFAGLILTVEHAFRTYVHSIGVLIAVLAAATMTVGNVIALRQRSTVRLLAWSTVAQAGYILVPLAVTRGTTDPVAASVAYLVLYAVMNLGAFGVVSALSADPSPYPISHLTPTQPASTQPASTHPSVAQSLAAQPASTQSPATQPSAAPGSVPAESSPAPAAESSAAPGPVPAESSPTLGSAAAARPSAALGSIPAAQPSGTRISTSPVHSSAALGSAAAAESSAALGSVPATQFSATRVFALVSSAIRSSAPAPARPSGASIPTSPSGGELAAYRGVYREHPRTAVALAFFLLCLAGLPPGVMGLFAKVVVFKAAVSGDMVWLAVVMAINVVIALYYYLRWAAVLFDVSLFGASVPGSPLLATPVSAAAAPTTAVTATPVTATPVTATPVTATPVTATPRSGAALSEEAVSEEDASGGAASEGVASEGAVSGAAGWEEAVSAAASSEGAVSGVAASAAAVSAGALPVAAVSGAGLSDEQELTVPGGAPVPALPRAVPALAQRIAIGIAFALAVVFSFWPNPALDAITFR